MFIYYFTLYLTFIHVKCIKKKRKEDCHYMCYGNNRCARNLKKKSTTPQGRCIYYLIFTTKTVVYNRIDIRTSQV